MSLMAFYDGGCPLCSKEIAHYRRADRHQRIRFIDITSAPAELAALGISTNTAMRRLHVLEPAGDLLQGVPAFIAIWQRLPGYRLLARIVLSLHLVRPLDWAYARFADWRFRRRCADGACSLD